MTKYKNNSLKSQIKQNLAQASHISLAPIKSRQGGDPVITNSRSLLGIRNGVSIYNSRKSAEQLMRGFLFLINVFKQGGRVLIVNNNPELSSFLKKFYSGSPALAGHYALGEAAFTAPTVTSSQLAHSGPVPRPEWATRGGKKLLHKSKLRNLETPYTSEKAANEQKAPSELLASLPILGNCPKSASSEAEAPLVRRSQASTTLVNLARAPAKQHAPGTAFVTPILSGAKGATRDLVTPKGARSVSLKRHRSNNISTSAHRWLGGTLTNWKQVHKAVSGYAYFSQRFQRLLASRTLEQKQVKQIIMGRQYKKVENTFQGLVFPDESRYRLAFSKHDKPDCIFIINPYFEGSILKEANRLDIPVVALTESTTDPSTITYPIPINSLSFSQVFSVLNAVVRWSVLFSPRFQRKDLGR